MADRTLAASEQDGFEIALRDHDGALELIVNGIFAMDSREVASEYAIADLVPAQARRVLIGGLGLGFTAMRLLSTTHAQLRIMELSSALVEWAEAGITPQLGAVAANPRVELVAGDVLNAFELADTYDAILLDVDNGPDFLIHEQNAALYQTEVLSAAVAALRPGGVLAVWSERFSAALDEALRESPGEVSHVPVTVHREGREFEYAIHTLHAPG